MAAETAVVMSELEELWDGYQEDSQDTDRRSLGGVIGAAGSAGAQPYGPGQGYGPGGGYGRGGGMMGGYGGGMMGGGGIGYGMLAQLNLTPEQWDKISAIQEETSKKQWELAGKMSEESTKLRKLMFAEQQDRNAITSQYKKVQDLRQQRFQARLDVQQKMDAVLTKEQKTQRRRFAPWWAQDEVE